MHVAHCEVHLAVDPLVQPVAQHSAAGGWQPQQGAWRGARVAGEQRRRVEAFVFGAEQADGPGRRGAAKGCGRAMDKR